MKYELVLIGSVRGLSNIILMSARVRVSGGHLCEAEAPTETTVETRKSAGILDVWQGLSTQQSAKFAKKMRAESYDNKF